MKFSFLVPIYNKEAYLKECIDSLLVQSGDYEIILVDDGSTDTSPVICDGYAKLYPNIRVIHKENGGLVSARETGIKNATGDYFLFVDSDDSVQPAMLKTLEAVLTSPIDIVIFGANEISGQVRNAFVKPELPDGVFTDKDKLYDQLFLSYSLNSLCIKCCKASLFDNLDLSSYRNCNYGEDMLITSFLFKRASSFLYLDEALYNYNVYSGMMAHYNPEFYLSYKKVNETVTGVLSSENIKDLVQKSGIHMLRSAYGAVIRFRYVKTTDKKELLRLSSDDSFRKAYQEARDTKYSDFLSKKEKLIVDLLYKRRILLLKIIIALRRLLDRF